MVKTSTRPVSITTRSPEETMALGRRVGALLAPGHVVALCGPLGAGKTTFVKGVAAGLGLHDARAVKSPTFVLIKEYAGRCPIAHVDLYRLDDAGDAERLHLQEYFATHACVIEWAEKFPQLLPADHVAVQFLHAAPTVRRLTFTPHGASSTAVVRALAPLDAMRLTELGRRPVT